MLTPGILKTLNKHNNDIEVEFTHLSSLQGYPEAPEEA